MKKRILALALCLVMAVSLLPVTALAEEFEVEYVCAVGNGDGNWLNGCPWNVDSSNYMTKGSDGVYEITYNNVSRDVSRVDDYWLKFYVKSSNGDGLDFSGNFVGSGIPQGASPEFFSFIEFEVPYDLVNVTLRLDLRGYDAATKQGATFTVTITDVHDWQFAVSESGDSLTANCRNCGVASSVNLTAHSVTLPDSPFNANVEVSENFYEAFPNAQIYGPYYYYNESGTFTKVDPNTFTPKAGQYQAQVYIDGLPGDKEIVARASSTDSVEYHESLWVDYTAVDPAVTAQTGDNRPIEIMMAGAAVFSILAIAAFLLDHKRKYSR